MISSMEDTDVLSHYIQSLSHINPQWRNNDLKSQFMKIKDIEAYQIACQKNHDGIYESSGVPITIERNPELGRHAVTSCDIKKGEIVLIEEPAILAPLVKSPMSKAKPVCLQCMKPVTNNSCHLCGFYLCVNHSEDQAPHANLCPILQKLKLAEHQEPMIRLRSDTFRNQMLEKAPTEEDKENVFHMIETAIESFLESEKVTILSNYPFLGVLQTILIEKSDPGLFEVLTNLQGIVNKTSKQYLVNNIRIVLPMIKKLNFSTDEQLLHKIAAIWDTNAFEVNLHEGDKCQGIYPGVSLCTHSCFANCEQNFLPSGHLILRAIQDMNRGSILTICYSDIMWPSHIRRQHLFMTKGFECSCDRCQDMTEIQTYMGSIICLQCRGFLVRTSNSSSEFVCCNCSAVIQLAQVAKIEAEASKRLQNIDLTSCECLQSAIEDLQSQIHDNHYLIIKLKLVCLHSIFKKSPVEKLENHQLEFLKTLSTSLFKTITPLVPPYGQYRAYVSKVICDLREEMTCRQMKVPEDPQLSDILECAKISHWNEK